VNSVREMSWDTDWRPTVTAQMWHRHTGQQLEMPVCRPSDDYTVSDIVILLQTALSPNKWDLWDLHLDLYGCKFQRNAVGRTGHKSSR